MSRYLVHHTPPSFLQLVAEGVIGGLLLAAGHGDVIAEKVLEVVGYLAPEPRRTTCAWAKQVVGVGQSRALVLR